jgi:hypothetical protein
MTRTATLILILAAALTCVMSSQNQADSPTPAPRLLRHVVLFRFKADATPDQIRKVEQGFAALPGRIREIQDFEWGTNNSPEGLDRGYTHCFLLTFKTEADRQTYLDHPEHRKFVEVLLPVLDEPHVLDYWATK